MVTEADILAGEVVNVATAKGTSPDPDKPDVPVTPGEDPEPTEEPNPVLTVKKTITSTSAKEEGYVLGETISYQIVVKNEGNLTITDIVVEDPMTGETWNIESLAPGAEQTFETSYVVKVGDVVATAATNIVYADGIASNEEVMSEVDMVVAYTTTIDIEITAASDEKQYDGQPLTNDGYELSDGELAEGNEIESVTVTGSQTDVGTSENVPSEAKIVDADGNDVTAGYKITYVNGTLEVTNNEVELTFTAKDAEKMYDGTELTEDGYELEGEIPKGLTVEVIIEGSQTNAGESENVIVEVHIYDAEGNDVTEFFPNITTVNGTLKVTKRQLILTSASDEKVYDGTPLTRNNPETDITVGGDGFADGEYAEYDITGSQTYVGSSDNEFTFTIFGKPAENGQNFFKKVLNFFTFGLLAAEGEEEAAEDEEFTAADNYDITVTYGTLTVTDDVDDSDVIVKEHEGKEYGAGETVTFTITVTNIYDEPKTITIEEIEGVTFLTANVFENVAPGETVTATAEYTITEEDIASGSFKNTATAKFSDVDKPYEGDDEVDIPESNPHMTIVKEITNKPADGKAYVEGEKIEYKITVTNDGNLTLNEIKVTDALTGDEWTVDELAPGESAEFTTSYTVTAADAKAGKVVNTATGSASSIDENQDPEVTPGTAETPVAPKSTPVGPKTGDESRMGLWAGMMGVSGLGLAALFVLLKRRRKEEEE